jgi:cytochrome bd-type quinol oxidase subunit 2
MTWIFIIGLIGMVSVVAWLLRLKASGNKHESKSRIGSFFARLVLAGFLSFVVLIPLGILAELTSVLFGMPECMLYFLGMWIVFFLASRKRARKRSEEQRTVSGKQQSLE